MDNIALHLKLSHLYWRAGFGPSLQQHPAPRNLKQAVRQLLREAENMHPLAVALPEPEKKPAGRQNAQERQKNQQERRQAIEQLNTTWLHQLATAPEQLREKMTLFWHGHFACRLRDPQLMQQQNNTFRQHALGKFPDLLLAVSKDPGMLQFLNNQQNRKEHPNENFARELLELFTLGRGHYTEQDIKEAARAFTGWGFNKEGKFVFRKRQHDDGLKTFMGQRGRFSGEDILRMVVESPRTAHFLTQKFYAFFVSDTPNEKHIRSLSNYFYASGYNISGLLEKIFTASWFYKPGIRGTKIKSPVELLAGLQRQFDVAYADNRSPLVLQRALGQELFRPPNVSGWAGGRNWIDSSTLAYRLRIGPALLQNAALEVSLKPDDDTEPTKPVRRRQDGLRIARAQASLAALQQSINEVKDETLAVTLSRLLLQVPLPPQTLELLQQRIPATASREEKLLWITRSLVALPEYQLC